MQIACISLRRKRYWQMLLSIIGFYLTWENCLRTERYEVCVKLLYDGGKK